MVDSARLQEVVNWAETQGACMEAVAAARRQGDISTGEWINRIRTMSEEEFPVAWVQWGYVYFKDFLTRDQLTIFLDRITDPMDAARAYLDFENLTEAQELLLLKRFHSEYREDKAVLFPTIEQELREGKIAPIERVITISVVR